MIGDFFYCCQHEREDPFECYPWIFHDKVVWSAEMWYGSLIIHDVRIALPLNIETLCIRFTTSTLQFTSISTRKTTLPLKTRETDRGESSAYLTVLDWFFLPARLGNLIFKKTVKCHLFFKIKVSKVTLLGTKRSLMSRKNATRKALLLPATFATSQNVMVLLGKKTASLFLVRRAWAAKQSR